MEATLSQLGTKHLLDTWYAVLQCFTEPRRPTEAWRISGIGHMGTSSKIVKRLLDATYLLETADGKLIMTESGRNLFTLLKPLIHIHQQ